MVDIQFRAWDLQEKKMYYSVNEGLEHWFSMFGHLENMQYTGLEDKNSVEIYEGDIIKIVNNLNEETKKYPSIVYIDFMNGAFVTQTTEKGREEYGYTYLNHLDSYNFPTVTFEVIGNIHGNPELLKGVE